MQETLDESYFKWLCEQIWPIETESPALTYWAFARQLYKREFVWIIPNDDNRVEDGKELRYEFFLSRDLSEIDVGWMHLGCSFLELLIALSRELSFIAEGESRDWFWKLVGNLDLPNVSDAVYSIFTELAVDGAIDAIIWRTYDPDGKGGLFPLENPSNDQRTIELWYQMNAYILERL
jgi:hypothetical protein